MTRREKQNEKAYLNTPHVGHLYLEGSVEHTSHIPGILRLIGVSQRDT